MNSISITINKYDYQPEEIVQGSLHWQLDKPPKEIHLKIGWHTEGRGTQDNQVAIEEVFSTDLQNGMKEFRCKLPASPYSFIGKLIELKWFVVAQTKKGHNQASIEIIVAPDRVPVKL